MADNQAHRFPKPSIQILPDEILLKIFSFVPLDELESSVGLTCKRCWKLRGIVLLDEFWKLQWIMKIIVVIF